MKPIVLSFCSLFSTRTLRKTETFLHLLDNEPTKTFVSNQSGIIIKLSITQKVVQGCGPSQHPGLLLCKPL